MLQRAGSAKTELLIFSLRNIGLHVSRCGVYEAENLIASFHNADILAPRPPSPEGRLTRNIRRVLRLKAPLMDSAIRVEKDYDLFLIICHSPHDLRYLELVENWHRCKKTICIVEEFWPSLNLSEDHVRILRSFDFLSSTLETAVDVIRSATGRPCYNVPWGIDALSFCPKPQPARHINVFSIGRRPPEIHQALMAMSDQDNLFYYVHDTVADFTVTDPREHRRQVINQIKRSQYFITYPARFNQPQVTLGIDEMGNRFFEGAAAGAVMIGMPPKCNNFRACFDWPDAVIPIEGNVAELIGQLTRQRRRLAHVRRKNVVNSLERHDWVYRWNDILNVLDIPPSPEMIQRSIVLQTQANEVARTRA
jgi:hypothetical protein